MRLLYCLTLVAALTAVTREGTAATVAPSRPAKAIAPFERSVYNNLVSYDFLFLPDVAERAGLATTYDSASQTLLIKGRVRIPGFAESPFRYHLSAIEDYEARLKFFAFELGRGISFSQDSMDCAQVAYSLDANLNAGPFETFIVAFKLAKPITQTQESLHFQLEDPVIFGGLIDVIIKKDELQ